MPEDGSECIDFKMGNWVVSVRSASPKWRFKETSALIRKVIRCATLYLNLEDYGRGTSVDFLLTEDDDIRRLNKIYRDNDKPTNVLSFEGVFSNESFGEIPQLLGSIALSIDTIEREAEEQKKTLNNHIAHLILHGVLHLLGYDHEKNSDADIMERTETNVLHSFGIADPYRA
ncbi:MAG: rRNA maturation RNase YbeY [Holosporales bacterium]|jgi:probable rRNA maturation factor|nr:rRNA maturation RNase YbeY [Holosporales bacterium]